MAALKDTSTHLMWGR